MNMLDGMDVMVVSYAAPSISKNWQVLPTALGVVFSAGLLGMSLGAMFLAPKADKIGRKTMILICNALMGVSVYATSWVYSIETLTFCRIISGIGIGGMLASTATITAEYAPKASKDFWVSLVMSGYPIGAVLSGLVAAQIIPSMGWDAIFQFAGITTFLTIPLVYFFLKESEEFLDNPKQPANVSVSALLQPKYQKQTIGLWLAIFMAFATLYFLTMWIPKLASVTHISEKMAIYAGTIFNLGAFFGIVSQGYISTQWGLSNTIGFYLFFTACLMLTFGFVHQELFILITFGLLGFGIQGGFVGMYSLAARIYPTEIRATGVGWAVGAGRIGAIIGPFLGGILIAQGLSMNINFIIFAIPTIIAGWAVIATRNN